MADDDDEMAALRASKHFKDHRSIYGDRSVIKKAREQAEKKADEEIEKQRAVRRAREEAEALNKFQADEDAPTLVDGSSSSAAGGEQGDGDGEPLPTADGEDDENDAMRKMFPMSFGEVAKRKVTVAEMHESKKRKVDDAKISINLSDKPLSSSSSSSSSSASSSATAKSEPGESGEVASAAAREANEGDDSDDDDDADDDEFDSNPYDLPISHVASLRGHSRAISALALDPSGSRLITGSLDYMIRFYNFAGMNEQMASFRQKEPEEGHTINQLQFSKTGDRFFCVTGSARPKIFDREGKELGHLIRGDPYLVDLTHTKGHQSGVSSGSWHPTNSQEVMTGGDDGTVRLWDINITTKNKYVMVYKSRAGQRTAVTAACFSPDGKNLAAAGKDGSIQLFKGAGSRPTVKYWGAHEADTITSSIAWSQDNLTFFTRGGDHTLKMWDMRNDKAPVNVVKELYNNYAMTDVILSPKEDLVLTALSARARLCPITGCAIRDPLTNKHCNHSFEKEAVETLLGGGGAAAKAKCPVPGCKQVLLMADMKTNQRLKAEQQALVTSGQSGGRILFYNRRDLSEVKNIQVSDKSAVRLQWHGGINQIFAGCADNETHVLYDPTKSTKGALLCAGVRAKRETLSDFVHQVEGEILNPYALKQFKKNDPKKQRALDRKDPLKARIPQPPIQGKGVAQGGRVANTSITQHFMKKILSEESITLQKDLDPREQILKYASAAASEPVFLGSAYAKTQPVPILAQMTPEELEDELLSAKISNFKADQPKHLR